MENGQERYSKEVLEEFEEIIRLRLSKLKRQIGKVVYEISGYYKTTDLNSPPPKQYSKEVATLKELAIKKLKNKELLENALIRIKNGTYGININTGKLIPMEKLRSRPWMVIAPEYFTPKRPYRNKGVQLM